MELSATKVWDTNLASDQLKSVTFQLLREEMNYEINEYEYVAYGDPIVLDGIVDANEKEPWVATWERLPQFRNRVDEHIYTVIETHVEDDRFKEISNVDFVITNQFIAEPAYEVTKVADVDSYSKIGDEIKYTITIKNTGNVPLDLISFNDPMFPDLVLDPNPLPLAVGTSTVLTATHTVTREDIVAGEVVNTVTVDAECSVCEVKDLDEQVDTETVPFVSLDASYTISKTVDKTTFQKVGDVLTYTITVTNTGELDLENVKIVDPMFPDLTLPKETLAVGEVVTIEVKHTITQADVDAKHVLNSVRLTGSTPNIPEEDLPDLEDEVDVPFDPLNPSYTFTKEANKTTYSRVGEIIEYTFTITKTGEATLTNLRFEDAMFADYKVTVTTLAPGESYLFKLRHTVTREDILAGKIYNSAKVGFDCPDCVTVIEDKEDEVTIPHLPLPFKLEFDKSANKETFTKEGEEIIFTFIVKNTGEVDALEVSIFDEFLNKVVGEKDILKPGEEYRTQITYKVTKADVERKFITNTAYVEAQCPDCPTDSIPPKDSVTVKLVPTLPYTGSTYQYHNQFGLLLAAAGIGFLFKAVKTKEEDE